MPQMRHCKPTPPRCALARGMATPIDKELIKREGWLHNAILVVALDDPRLDMVGREFVRQIGRQLYGKES